MNELKQSIDSIRWDLLIWENQELLKRTHGGEIPFTQTAGITKSAPLRYGEGQ
jgi:DeoR/GlpR family transcriptional regulator of sugar metabolism